MNTSKRNDKVKSGVDTEQSIFLLIFCLYSHQFTHRGLELVGKTRGKLCVGVKNLCDVLLVPWLPLGSCAAS